uniref:CD8+ T cell target antigen Tp2 n=1 Tax=Theileria parva TaxID=5875 RepID=F6LWP1_THEPA|nr:CD8+ T cell target antigen Tp2 [Theileria parva]
MKLAARLISLYFIIFILPSSVLGGNCTVEELREMGMVEGDGFDRELLFKSSHGMGKIGRKHGLKTKPRLESVLEDLEKLFGQHGLGDISKNCLKCLAQSIVCVVSKCRAACLKGPCTDGCQRCIEANCKKALLECIGTSDIPNPCKWESDYLKYKLPDTDEDESEKKGEASGTS